MRGIKRFGGAGTGWTGKRVGEMVGEDESGRVEQPTQHHLICPRTQPSQLSRGFPADVLRPGFFCGHFYVSSRSYRPLWMSIKVANLPYYETSF
jgi:hypothetical protein